MGRNWALVIGINKYNSLEHLKYAKADAEAMHGWLKDEGKFDRLFLFTDDSPEIQTNLPERPILTHPTIGNLRTFFNQQFKYKLMKDVDNLWFFFSGHGRRGTEGDYLVLSDSDPEDTHTLLPVSYITERLRNWGAGNVVMFIDACRNLEDRPKAGRMITSGYQGMITFYSCQDGETSLEIKSRGRGAFTQVVLQALEAAKRENRCLTVAGLEGYLMEEVPKLSPNQHPLARVEPTYKSDFILFGEAGEEDIQRLKDLGFRKAVLGNREEAIQIFLYANRAAKGNDSEILDALTLLRGRQSSQKSPIVIEPIGIDPQDYYQELLGEGVESLKMISIPAGKFWMGTKNEEITSLRSDYLHLFEREKPQHWVNINSFYMGKFPVTQTQWKMIASRQDLRSDIDLKLDPSYFKGNNRPVEQVTWDDAIEFCKRLSKLTGRKYRLPSEAEWEYACRAGTDTPFHFGKTITGNLANYRADVVYTNEAPGEFREKTTNVGQFAPNDFGLHDMHGNVWEWCADRWHENYDEDEGAPRDGSAWMNMSATKNLCRVMRGGSCFNIAEFCRSAFRQGYSPDFKRDPKDKFGDIGFRVVCDKTDYTKLQKLFDQKKWKEADQETTNLILKVSNREEEGSLRKEDIQNLPREELRTIDRLWVSYSRDRFGFSVQREIYREICQNLGDTIENVHVQDNFADTVGWRVDKEYKDYEDIGFDLEASRGHLPTIWTKKAGWNDHWIYFLQTISCEL